MEPCLKTGTTLATFNLLGYIPKARQLFRINDNPDRPAEDRQNVDIITIAKAIKKISERDEETTELKWFDINHLPPKEKIAFDFSDHLELYKKYFSHVAYT